MRPIDPLEKSARELCLVSGVDPDERVPNQAKPGKTMPAWCGFRDLARSRQQEVKAAEAAASFANARPQLAQYQNAPLQVFGEHQQNTLEQMRACMSVGNVVGGVLCADGHLGYAQPVGGVIAYDGQVSISGVGFDIGCFTGDTRVFLGNGNTISLAEACGHEISIIACSSKKAPVNARGVVKKTRKNAELIKICLENGHAIRCTPDHRFMLPDGEWTEAGKLSIGQRLMSVFPHNQSSATSIFRVGASCHYVTAVEPLEDREDVYCLTVPGLHNFALADGVFVHNCGNGAIRLDTKFADIENNVEQIIDDIWKVISFGVGRTNDEKVSHELFDDADAWRMSDMSEYRKKAVSQLGTVGSGNHYVDLFTDENGYVWVGVHFGSRGLGHTSATRYMKLAGGKDGMNVAPALVDEDSELGQRYIAAMNLAGRYAFAGRDWVMERVRKIIGGSVTDKVTNHHNSAWKETHVIDGQDRELWVVRKGATPAFPGQRGFVGGSMGDNAVILEGIDSEEARRALYSTVHGAGRLFGRKAAKQAFTRAEMDAWLHDRGVHLRGGDLDESPMAYRRLPDVLDYHAGSVKVMHTLKPFAVAMAGHGEFDPYKD